MFTDLQIHGEKKALKAYNLLVEEEIEAQRVICPQVPVQQAIFDTMVFPLNHFLVMTTRSQFFLPRLKKITEFQKRWMIDK